VIEDDYDAEYRYDRAPVGAMQGLDPGNVVYCGSVSKRWRRRCGSGGSFSPSASRTTSASRRRPTTSARRWSTSSHWPTSSRGDLDRHLRASRLEDRRRRDALVAALAHHLPDAHVDGIAAGLHLVVRLLDGADESRVVDAARARGVGADGLSEHRFAPGPPALLLGYGRIPASAIAAAVHELVSSIDLTHR
jgi:GntR family transcriptional regulator/MocR family aminotransferase